MEKPNDVIVVSRPSRFPTTFLLMRGWILAPLLALVCGMFIAFGITVVVESGTIRSIGGYYSEENNYQYMAADPAVNINMKLWGFTADGVEHRQGSKARINFTVDRQLEPPVYLYYTLTHFYQSISFFHDGRSSEQLAGFQPTNFLFRCHPYKSPGYLDGSGNRIVSIAGGQAIPYDAFMYYPCGSAAWSMFNDSFTLYRILDGSLATYRMPDAATDPIDASAVELICNGTDFDADGTPLGQSTSVNHCRKQGISRPQDVSTRFKPVTHSHTSWAANYPFSPTDDYLRQGWYANEAGHKVPDPADLDFQVWMASAPTPNFRKLYRIITTPITPGTYILEVDEFFDSFSFRGRKGFTLRTDDSWLVEPNGALGISYITLGASALVVCLLVVAKAIFTGRKHAKEDRVSLQNSGVDASADEVQSIAAHKRWYTFDPHSENMNRYVELRREREDIRKWALANPQEEDDEEEEESGEENDTVYDSVDPMTVDGTDGIGGCGSTTPVDQQNVGGGVVA